MERGPRESVGNDDGVLLRPGRLRIQLRCAPRTSARIADELSAAVDALKLPPPYILVGTSFGTFDLRLFARRRENDVAGAVLVNPSAEQEELVAPTPAIAEIDKAGLDHGRLCLKAATDGTLRTNVGLSNECIGPPDDSPAGAARRKLLEGPTRGARWFPSGRTSVRAPKKLQTRTKPSAPHHSSSLVPALLRIFRHSQRRSRMPCAHFGPSGTLGRISSRRFLGRASTCEPVLQIARRRGRIPSVSWPRFKPSLPLLVMIPRSP